MLKPNNKIKVEVRVCTLSECEVIVRTELDVDFPERTYNELDTAKEIITDIFNEKLTRISQRNKNND